MIVTRADIPELLGHVVSAVRVESDDDYGPDHIELTFTDGRKMQLEGIGYDGWWRHVIVSEIHPEPEVSAVEQTRKELGIRR